MSRASSATKSRSKSVSVVLVIAVALLAVSAQPVSAASAGLAVGSQHTTGQEFSNAQTLDNMAVSGDNLELAVSSTIDSFEDGDVAEYSGDTGSVSVVQDSSTAVEGDYYLQTDTSASIYSSSGLNDYPARGDTFSYRVRFDTTTSRDLFSFGRQDAGNHYNLFIYNDATEVRFRKYTGGSITNLETVQTGDIPEDEWLTVEVAWGSPMVVTVRDSSGTEIATLSATDSTFDSGGVEFNSVGTVKYDAAKVLGGSGTGTYVSKNHTVDAAEAASFNVTSASNVSAELSAEYYDGSSWVVANSTTATTAGDYTVELPSVSSSTWRVRVVADTTGGDAQFSLADESILFDPAAPSASNLDPADGTELSDPSVEFTIDVNDSDFSLAQGDEVTAQLQLQEPGSSTWTDAGNQTVTTNSTVTVTETLGSGGTWSYRWQLTDAYGESTTTSSRTVSAPAEITFRSEQNPDQILTNVTVNVTAYYGDEVARRSTSDGTINLTGFPVDEPIIIRAGGENYTTRTAIVESIYEQNNMYLLNDTVPTYQVRFDIQDPTGQYPRSDTVLFVGRDLELNGSTEWRVIAGDNFGVRGVPVTIEQGERYRLRVKNLETGTIASIGPFTAIQSETVTLSPGSATIDVVSSEQEYGWELSEDEENQHIVFEYLDTENATSSIKLTIHERFNKSNVVVDNVTFSDTNSIVYQQDLTANETNKTWMAEIYITRNGTTSHFREPVTGPRVSIIPSELDGTWRSAIGVFILLITGMMFSQINQASGAVGTALVGGMLWQIGFLSTVATAPAIGLSIGVAVLYHYRGSGGGI